LVFFEFLKKKNRNLCYLIRIFILITVKKPHLNILIFHGDTKGDTGLLGNTVPIYRQIYFSLSGDGRTHSLRASFKFILYCSVKYE